MVEVDLPARRRNPVAGDVRVRSFTTDVPGAEDPVTLANTLLAMRQQRKLAKEAWVTIWGLKTATQFLRLPPAKPAALETLAAREARKDIAALETGGERASVAVVLGNEVPVGSQRKREVSLVAVSSDEVRRRIQPLVDAGFVVEGVVTPALALTAIARAHRDLLPGSVAAYVALSARATCLAIIRDGVLLFAREMPWGHDLPVDAGSTHGETVGARLASELKRSVLYFKQTFRTGVEAVVLCGDMPNLRALTGPLGAALEVPVKPLDSLTGIDAANVPEPADQFRADVASLRLAIAVGAEPTPPANLLPSAIRVSRAARAEFTRIAAAIAAGVVLVVGAYFWTQRTAEAYAAERSQLEQQIGQLRPEAQRLAALRLAFETGEAQRATLGALETQGPRLARFLEALSQSTPDDIVISNVTADADGTTWAAIVTGVAISGDATAGQEAVNALIAAMTVSPFAGAPVEPPALRVVTGTGAAASAAGGQRAQIPAGLSGVEFVLRFRVPR
jgi:hypothetical protein